VTSATDVRLTAWVEGRVQGVGFRWWVRSRALELGLSGFAENLADGRVKVVAEGPEDRCQELLALLAGTGLAGTGSSGTGFSGAGLAGNTGLAHGTGRPGWVRNVAHRWAEAAGSMSSFTER
jgi:acylphosphatase